MKALAVAAGAGALGYYLVSRTGWSDLLKGALVGVGVQTGVRLAGVS